MGLTPPNSNLAPLEIASETKYSTLSRVSAFTNGPTSTSGSTPFPILSAAIFFENIAMNLSFILSCTYILLAAVQASPRFRIFATIRPSAAASMFASLQTINGAFPPNSIAGLTILSAAACNNFLPTSVEPVKLTTLTLGSESILETTAPDDLDGRIFTTPGGTPASERIGIKASIVKGVSDAGFTITGHPAASAGPIFLVPIAAG